MPLNLWRSVHLVLFVVLLGSFLSGCVIVSDSSDAAIDVHVDIQVQVEVKPINYNDSSVQDSPIDSPDVHAQGVISATQALP